MEKSTNTPLTNISKLFINCVNNYLNSLMKAPLKNIGDYEVFLEGVKFQTTGIWKFQTPARRAVFTTEWSALSVVCRTLYKVFDKYLQEYLENYPSTDENNLDVIRTELKELCVKEWVYSTVCRWYKDGTLRIELR